MRLTKVDQAQPLRASIQRDLRRVRRPRVIAAHLGVGSCRWDAGLVDKQVRVVKELGQTRLRSGIARKPYDDAAAVVRKSTTHSDDGVLRWQRPYHKISVLIDSPRFEE